MSLPRDPSAHPIRRLTREDRAAVTARAVAAAAAVARAHGIRVDEPVVLADRYAVRVHLRPAPLVARVSTFTAIVRAPIAPWLARELAVTSYLAARGAPVVAPSGLLPPGPHVHDGFGISFWAHVEAVTDAAPGPEVAGRMLAELHAVLRDYRGELPYLTPLQDIASGLERIERIGVLPQADVALLRRLAAELPARIDRDAPTQALHGDAHPWNLIPTAHGPLWNDFEDTCRGPVAWDLSTLSDPENRMLAAYPGAPPLTDIEPYRQLRLLQAAIYVYAVLPEYDEWEAAAQGILGALRSLA